MRKILPILLTASLVVACQDQQPTGVPDDVPISFDLSDGSTPGGNRAFFFLPPLADDPSGNPDYDEGEFNAFLAPFVFVRICELESASQRVCVDNILNEPMDLGTNHYSFGWRTGDYGGLTDGTIYRIHIYVGNEETGLLGYRDVVPLPNPSTASCTSDPESDCQINNGSNVPIKVWIGENAFCPEGTICQTRSFDLANGGAAFDLQGQYLLGVPQQPASKDGTVTFQTCDFNEVAAEIDLPTFGPFCLEIVNLTPDFDGQLDPDFTATISFCEADVDTFGLSTAQAANLRVHHFRGVNGEDGVEALRVANECPEPTASLSSNRVQRFASRILSWITPRPLQAAAVVGKGGFGGNSLETLGSRFIIALPAKIDFVDVADATRVAPTGSTLTTQAKVTDLNGDPVAGATVRWNVADVGVEGAEVAGSVAPLLVPDGCAADTPDDVICTTGSSGIVGVDWTLATDPGINKLTAGGRGIADSRDGFNGPRDGTYTAGPFDPFQPIAAGEKDGDPFVFPEDEISTEIEENTRLLFTAIGCEPGFGTPNAIDGTMDPGEWDCAIQEPFPVNVSGGSSVEATLYYMNDNTDFHLAVVVPGTGRVNGLRIEWDDDGAGREPGNDVWEFEPDGGPADKFVDDKCSTSSQSSCGNNDADFLTTPDVGMDTEAAFNNTVGGQTVYEMSHPLSTGQVCEIFGRKGCSSAFPIDLQAAKGQTKGASFTLRLGSGAQGNTQWPGFLEYLMIEIK
jgi:hypothetical protein